MICSRDRRKELLERQLINGDSRLVADLLAAQADTNSGQNGNPSPRALGMRGYFVAEVDGKDHDWFTIQVEPRDLEEVQISQFDRRRNIRDVWSSFHSLDDFTPGTLPDPFTAPPPKRDESDAADNDGRDDAPEPDQERWSAPVRVPTVDVDLTLDGNGEAKGTAALAFDALRPMAAVRLNISPFLEVTDVRWAPRQNDAGADEPARPDQAEATTAAGQSVEDPDPSEPEPLRGEPLHFVQEKHDRRFSENLYEPWVTVKLPRLVDRGERFTLELAYEGKLVERLRSSQEFFLRDTPNWYPRHPDARRSSFRLTFRVPERNRVASGGTLMEDRVEGKTRIVRWVVEEPVYNMAFHYGRFDVSHIQIDGVPPIALYTNSNHIGFAPGNREKTIEDLAGSIRVYSDYFWPFPFASLVVAGTRRAGLPRVPPAVIPDLRRSAHGRGGTVPLARDRPSMVGVGGRLGGLPRSVAVGGVRAVRCRPLRARRPRRGVAVPRHAGGLAPRPCSVRRTSGRGLDCSTTGFDLRSFVKATGATPVLWSSGSD